MSGTVLHNETLGALISCSQFIVHVKKLEGGTNNRFRVLENLGIRGFIPEGKAIEVGEAAAIDNVPEGECGRGKWAIQRAYTPTVNMADADELILFLNKSGSGYEFSMENAYEDISFKSEISIEPVPPIAVAGVAEAERKSLKNKNFQLETGKSLNFEGLLLELISVVFEEILGCPGLEESMPAGSGVVVALRVNADKEEEELQLNELSSPYESISSATWSDFKITLLKVEDYNKPVVHLKIDVLSRNGTE